MTIQQGNSVVLKVGGAVADAGGALLALPRLVEAGLRPVVVHGGGKEISAWMAKLNLPVSFKDGLRVTDAASIELAMMVLCGKVSTLLVSALAQTGVRALGMSGADASVLVARPHADPEVGLVGEVQAVDSAALRQLGDLGYVPVIAPIAPDPSGQLRNINADSVCGAIAGALNARLAMFLTDVSGVLDATGALMPRLTTKQVTELMLDGTIHGGMIPKVKACLAALQAGAQAVCIADGRDARALEFLLHGGEPSGTVISQERGQDVDAC